MFVPRAVNRKPARHPVKKRLEAPPNRNLSRPDCQHETKNNQSSTLELCKNVPLTPSTVTCSSESEKGDEGLIENITENVTSCQSDPEGSEPAVIVLEGSSTNSETSLASTSVRHNSMKIDSKCPKQAAAITPGSVSKAECKHEYQTFRTKPDCDSSPKEDTNVGVSGGIRSNLFIDIAAIRKSVDRIKSHGRLASNVTGDLNNEHVADDDDGDNLEGEEEKDEDNKDVEEVVSYSKNQRWPIDEEPVCVMCGRYGAYICDQTEADVCSRECKARNLTRRGRTAGLKESPSQEKDVQTEMDLGKVLVEEEPIGYIYKEHDEVSELTREQVQEIRAQVDIFVEGVDIPRPVIEFSYLAAPKKMESNLASVGYNTPTPVQMQVIPSALRWRDMMVCAQTSSGKTAAFLVPTILQIYNSMCFRDSKDEGNGPLGLILSPSRELAMQIEEQAKQLMQGLPNMRTALVIGGLPMPTQLHRLKQDIQFIIATPGRILDIISREGVTLAAIKTVIIDEVDTMLHKGFQEQVMEVMGHLPESHQTMLFSATIPPSIERLATSLLHNPLYISVGKPNTPCTSVKQIVMWVEEPAKKKNLFAILQDPKHYRPPLVVFVDSKIGAGLLSLAIHKMCDIHAASLHGDRPQSERTETLRCFREGEYPVLVCTAVLGRGIDLPGVKMVVNFDMPSSVEEYIHQIGRTGRLGSKGTAITFINNGSKKSFADSNGMSRFGQYEVHRTSPVRLEKKYLFLEFVNTLRPLGVPLPPKLTNSTHLRYQQLGHQSWQETRRRRKEKMDEDEDREMGRHGNASYFGYKRRKQEESAVGELLKKRKHKGPR